MDMRVTRSSILQLLLVVWTSSGALAAIFTSVDSNDHRPIVAEAGRKPAIDPRHGGRQTNPHYDMIYTGHGNKYMSNVGGYGHGGDNGGIHQHKGHVQYAPQFYTTDKHKSSVHNSYPPHKSRGTEKPTEYSGKIKISISDQRKPTKGYEHNSKDHEHAKGYGQSSKGYEQHSKGKGDSYLKKMMNFFKSHMKNSDGYYTRWRRPPYMEKGKGMMGKGMADGHCSSDYSDDDHKDNDKGSKKKHRNQYQDTHEDHKQKPKFTVSVEVPKSSTKGYNHEVIYDNYIIPLDDLNPGAKKAGRKLVKHLTKMLQNSDEDHTSKGHESHEPHYHKVKQHKYPKPHDRYHNNEDEATFSLELNPGHGKGAMLHVGGKQIQLGRSDDGGDVDIQLHADSKISTRVHGLESDGIDRISETQQEDEFDVDDYVRNYLEDDFDISVGPIKTEVTGVEEKSVIDLQFLPSDTSSNAISRELPLYGRFAFKPSMEYMRFSRNTRHYPGLMHMPGVDPMMQFSHLQSRNGWLVPTPGWRGGSHIHHRLRRSPPLHGPLHSPSVFQQREFRKMLHRLGARLGNPDQDKGLSVPYGAKLGSQKTQAEPSVATVIEQQKERVSGADRSDCDTTGQCNPRLDSNPRDGLFDQPSESELLEYKPYLALKGLSPVSNSHHRQKHDNQRTDHAEKYHRHQTHISRVRGSDSQSNGKDIASFQEFNLLPRSQSHSTDRNDNNHTLNRYSSIRTLYPEHTSGSKFENFDVSSSQASFLDLQDDSVRHRHVSQHLDAPVEDVYLPKNHHSSESQVSEPRSDVADYRYEIESEDEHPNSLNERVTVQKGNTSSSTENIASNTRQIASNTTASSSDTVHKIYTQNSTDSLSRVNTNETSAKEESDSFRREHFEGEFKGANSEAGPAEAKPNSGDQREYSVHDLGLHPRIKFRSKPSVVVEEKSSHLNYDDIYSNSEKIKYSIYNKFGYRTGSDQAKSYQFYYPDPPTSSDDYPSDVYSETGNPGSLVQQEHLGLLNAHGFGEQLGARPSRKPSVLPSPSYLPEEPSPSPHAPHPDHLEGGHKTALDQGHHGHESPTHRPTPFGHLREDHRPSVHSSHILPSGLHSSQHSSGYPSPVNYNLLTHPGISDGFPSTRPSFPVTHKPHKPANFPGLGHPTAASHLSPGGLTDPAHGVFQHNQGIDPNGNSQFPQREFNGFGHVQYVGVPFDNLPHVSGGNRPHKPGGNFHHANSGYPGSLEHLGKPGNVHSTLTPHADHGFNDFSGHQGAPVHHSFPSGTNPSLKNPSHGDPVFGDILPTRLPHRPNDLLSHPPIRDTISFNKLPDEHAEDDEDVDYPNLTEANGYPGLLARPTLSVGGISHPASSLATSGILPSPTLPVPTIAAIAESQTHAKPEIKPTKNLLPLVPAEEWLNLDADWIPLVPSHERIVSRSSDFKPAPTASVRKSSSDERPPSADEGPPSAGRGSQRTGGASRAATGPSATSVSRTVSDEYLYSPSADILDIEIDSLSQPSNTVPPTRVAASRHGQRLEEWFGRRMRLGSSPVYVPLKNSGWWMGDDAYPAET